MKTVSKTLITVSMMSLLAACGDMKTDPTTEYKDVDGLVAPHNDKTPNQKIYEREAFNIQPEEGKRLGFMVGKAGSYNIVVTTMAGVHYNLKMKQNPEGMTLTKSAKPGVYELKWTPTASDMTFESGPREVAFELELLPGTDPRALAVFNNPAGPLNRTISHPYTVSQLQEQPEIVAIEGLKESINEGESFEFSVKIKDPSSQKDSPPEISLTGFAPSVNELYEANGSGFVHMSKGITANGDGTFTAYLVFNTKIAAIPVPLNDKGEPDPAASSVSVRFGLEAKGSNNLKSPAQPVRVKVNLNKSSGAPVISFGGGRETITVETGEKNDIQISTYSRNNRAKVDINTEALRKALEGIPGRPSLSCEDNSRTSQIQKNCSITWKVPCEDASLKSSYSVTVEASATIYGKTETSKVAKTLKVERVADNCRATVKTQQSAPASSNSATAKPASETAKPNGTAGATAASSKQAPKPSNGGN